MRLLAFTGRSADLPLVVLSHIGLFLSRELTQGVDHLAVIVLAVTHIFGGAEQSQVDLTGASTDMVPVNEVDMSKLAQIQLAVLDGQGLTAAKEKLRR